MIAMHICLIMKLTDNKILADKGKRKKKMHPVELLKKYLQIKSVQPNPDYDGCVKLLAKVANEMKLPINVYEVGQNKLVVITWKGQDPTLPSILLNSHMDVVPVYEDKWTYPPFEARELDGKIYARGSQDMKTVGIVHLMAVKKLIEQGFKPKRTIHISFVPDEEIGSVNGMGKFVETKEFRDLNVGFSFDESGPIPQDRYVVYNAERAQCKFRIRCTGTAGHGSLLLENTASEKLRIVVDELSDFRQKIEKIVEKYPKDAVSLIYGGEHTTINITMLEGGVQNNVVPPEMIITYDSRVSVHEDKDEFKKMLEGICKKAGEGTFLEYLLDDPQTKKTDMDNPFCQAFKKSLNKSGHNFVVASCPAASDARFLRLMGIPALGFSPLKQCEIRIHDHDEYITVSTFLEGIDVMAAVLKDTANV